MSAGKNGNGRLALATMSGGRFSSLNESKAWDHAGPSRNPDLSDGSTATERLTEYTAGHSFAYELTVRTGVTHRRRSNATTAQASSRFRPT